MSCGFDVEGELVGGEGFAVGGDGAGGILLGGASKISSHVGRTRLGGDGGIDFFDGAGDWVRLGVVGAEAV